MISRSAPVRAVCFRCRIRLLRQSAPVRYVASDADAAAPPPATATATTNGARDRADGDGPDPKATGAGADPVQIRKQKSRRSSEFRLDLGTQYISRNRILNEAAARLGPDMLGKPAYAIVMKDGGIRRKETPLPSYEDKSESPENLAAAGIEALLDDQRVPPTQEEVRSNISGLQPQTDKVLPEKDFRKLQALLTGGFLNAQLHDYIGWHKKQETTADSPPPPEFPWILERRPWVPLQSQPDAVEAVDPMLQGYVSDTATPKDKLGIRLMRECWGLSIAELQTQQGETWIKLPTCEFVLLMRGTQRFLHGMSNIFLEPGEKIEAFRDETTLRLVTTKIKADLLLEELDKILQGVTTKTFPVLLLDSGLPDPAVLEQVGQITNTHVWESRTGKRLHVAWIEIKSRAARSWSAVEDMAHIVLRLLLTASGSQQPTSSLLSPTLSREFPGRLILDNTSRDKLGWKDRLARWARYVHPQTPMSNIVDAALPLKEFELPFEPLARPKPLMENSEFFEENKFPFHPVQWSNVGQTSTTAHFGHILHPYQVSNPTPLLSDLLASTDRRVFAPLTPHPVLLSRLELNNLGSNPLVTTKFTLVLRFWPSPSSTPSSKPRSSKAPPKHAGDTPPAPVLELRIKASDNEVQEVESLRAITRTHHTDVMMPSSLVDIRFTQTHYETLLAPDRQKLAAWQPIFDFLNNARLELADGKLEMPPRQRFPIPRRLFTKYSSTESIDPTSVPEFVPGPEDPDDLPSISYEFVGLELHRSATLPFEGHQLTYTSIEAGQGGGRRAEVTLEPLESIHSSSSTEAADKDEVQQDFLACCSRFVRNHTLWSGYNKRKSANVA
ncbi:hypothetical protein F5Y12DRAFT_737931 [Xylaria sp. FL1777]|nr:hypothetical protein F5Y12DRAFT_737931 [Xylaria sp. FL1777]